MKARRVIIYGKEDIDIVEEAIDESQLGYDKFLIKCELSLISPGTELSRVFALKEGATYPVYPGYCSVGKVLKCGDNSYGIREGDRVLYGGAHASAQLFDPSNSPGGVIYKLADETSSQRAAYMEMCWIAMNGILPVDVKMFDTVIVYGMGTLGIIVSQYYQLMGCEVYAVEPVENRRKLARKAGVKNVIADYHELNGKEGDIVVDASGVSICIEHAIETAKKYGTVVLLGSPREPLVDNVSTSFYAIHSKMLNVVGALNSRYPYHASRGSNICAERGMQYIEKLLNEGKLEVDSFVSHVVKPEKEALLEAYRGLMYDKQHYTGVIIDWSNEA